MFTSKTIILEMASITKKIFPQFSIHFQKLQPNLQWNPELMKKITWNELH